MDLSTANAFVFVVSDNFAHYSIATQRTLLEGCFQLADECKEDLTKRSDVSAYEHLQTSLTLAKLFASDALKNGDLREGFRLVAECFWPTAAVPQGFA
jgi:hypothetical protein